MLIPNMGMRNAARPSVQSYSHFTGFLAYGMVYGNKSSEHFLSEILSTERSMYK